MHKLSVKLIKSLTITLLVLSFQTVIAAEWPIQTKIDLSSGFGDFRANRFHTGVDLRTGGKVGTQIIAPVSGYIHRVRASYNGYGKGLYLKGDDGFIYVFGHLLDFGPKIDVLVKAEQRMTKRYFLDMYLEKDQIIVKKGDFLGYTGQTGAGAPHLHFEKRTKDNVPLNPLTNGFSIDDLTKPIFDKIGFKMLDATSLFDNGLREVVFNTTYDSLSQNYFLDTLVYFNRPFGMFTDVYDKMRDGGMQQSVYKLTLKIDNDEFYSVKFDKLDFDKQQAVNLRYEYLHAVNKEKRVQRLYDEYGEDFDGSRSVNKSNGIIGVKNNIKYGHHKGEIIAEDAFGNKRSLHFKFIYGPEEELYSLDSHIVILQKENYFYFTPNKDISEIEIDSVAPFMNRADQWGLIKSAVVTKLPNGQIECKLVGFSTSTTTIRLFAFSKKAIIRDNIFNGVIPKGKQSVSLFYDILENGILVTLKVKARQSADSRIELYANDKLIDILYPRLFNMNQYQCLIPPLEKYEKIDKIGFAMSKDPTYPLQFRDSLKIHLVGHKNNQKINFAGISFEFEKDNFYRPRFIEIDKRFYLKDNRERLETALIEIKPKAFLCKSNFKMVFTIKKIKSYTDKSGFSWFDEEEKKWVWLENELDGNRLTSESSGGGTFAVIYDLLPPKLSRLNIFDQKTYPNGNLRIVFKVEDKLSDIADDQAFHVKLDKEWLIPEYDPESKQFVAKPKKPLSSGKHYLAIQIVDRVGNKFEQYLNFFVKSSKRINRGR